MRTVCLDPQSLAPLSFINLVIAVAPNDARIPLEGQDVRGHSIQEPTVVADDHRTAAEIEQGLLERRSISTSRSFVGSSKSNKLPPLLSSFARCTRFRSPPES